MTTLASYSQAYVPGGSGLPANTPITLPSSQTYTGVELKVELNGQGMDPGLDYTYVGAAPRTQIQFTFALPLTDEDKSALLLKYPN